MTVNSDARSVIIGYALVISLGADFQKVVGRGQLGLLFTTRQEAEEARLEKGHPQHWKIAEVHLLEHSYD